jgi:hypothetical protein
MCCSSRVIAVLMAGVLLMAGAAAADVGIPDPELSTAEMATPGPHWVLVCPAGDGETLDALPGDSDATITVHLVDHFMYPVGFFPAADLWLEIAPPGPLVVACPGRMIADDMTDGYGVTTFSGPFQAGACGYGTMVVINGQPLVHPPLELGFVSPDLDGDLVVDLTDVVQFATAYLHGYEPCCDFYHDGALDLTDVILLAQHLTHACP